MKRLIALVNIEKSSECDCLISFNTLKIMPTAVFEKGPPLCTYAMLSLKIKKTVYSIWLHMKSK